MQRGGGRANGKVNEIEEYFVEQNDRGEPDVWADDAINSEYNKDSEEVRRLTALVAHLRDQVDEIESQPGRASLAGRNLQAFPLSATVGLLAFGFIGALWVLRTRH